MTLQRMLPRMAAVLLAIAAFVAVGCGGGDELRVYLHKGQAWTMISAAAGVDAPSSIACGDLDRDGRPDISTATRRGNPDDDVVTWLRNAP